MLRSKRRPFFYKHDCIQVEPNTVFANIYGTNSGSVVYNSLLSRYSSIVIVFVTAANSLVMYDPADTRMLRFELGSWTMRPDRVVDG